MINDKDWIYMIQESSDVCIDSVHHWMQTDQNFQKYSKEICNLSYLEYMTCMTFISKIVSIYSEELKFYHKKIFKILSELHTEKRYQV